MGELPGLVEWGGVGNIFADERGVALGVSVNVGGRILQCRNVGDLKSAAATLLSVVDQVLTGHLELPVSEVAALQPTAQIKYDGGANSWTVGDYTFGLTGSVCGTVSVLEAGRKLMTYTKAFPATIGDGLSPDGNKKAADCITVPAGQFYLQVALDMTLGVNAGGQGQAGLVSLKGSVTNADTFRVVFSKRVGGDMVVEDALVAALEGFVLPLHGGTYAGLAPGDYLYHGFNATLNVGFGATYGVDTVYFSGQYKADIPNVPAAPAVVTTAKLEVRAGATLNATFKYTGSFEAMLWKADDATARLHLYKNKTTDASLTLGVGATVIADPAVSIGTADLSKLLAKVMPNGTGSTVGKLIEGKAQDAVNSWGGELQDRIEGWLKPAQKGDIALDVAIENTSASYLLMDFTFDTAAPGFAQAWGAAIAGDLVAALGVADGGASLDTGCGLEEFHARKTSVSFHVFGAFQAEWTEALIDSYSMVYVGDNTFHLVEDIGRQSLSTVTDGGSTEADFYFAAEAVEGPAGTVVNGVDLHVLLKAKGNRRGANGIAALLSSATTGDASQSLTKQILAVAGDPKAAVTLRIILKPAAYAALVYTEAGPGGNVANDVFNFNEFARACMLLNGSAPSNFQTQPVMDYGGWRVWNIAVNNRYPPGDGDVPDRRSQGNPLAGLVCLGERYKGAPAAQVGAAFGAASGFMNLCEDLRKLATLEDGGMSWNGLVADLKGIVQKDVDVDFIPATALGLIECVEQPGVAPVVTGPVAGAKEVSVGVVLRYGD